MLRRAYFGLLDEAAARNLPLSNVSVRLDGSLTVKRRWSLRCVLPSRILEAGQVLLEGLHARGLAVQPVPCGISSALRLFWNVLQSPQVGLGLTMRGSQDIADFIGSTHGPESGGRIGCRSALDTVHPRLYLTYCLATEAKSGPFLKHMLSLLLKLKLNLPYV